MNPRSTRSDSDRRTITPLTCFPCWSGNDGISFRPSRFRFVSFRYPFPRSCFGSGSFVPSRFLLSCLCSSSFPLLFVAPCGAGFPFRARNDVFVLFCVFVALGQLWGLDVSFFTCRVLMLCCGRLSGSFRAFASRAPNLPTPQLPTPRLSFLGLPDVPS